jgi:hypothetical protein
LSSKKGELVTFFEFNLLNYIHEKKVYPAKGGVCVSGFVGFFVRRLFRQKIGGILRIYQYTPGHAGTYGIFIGYH